MHGRGACMAGVVHGRGVHAWHGGMRGRGGMHGRGCMHGGGHAWQGACMAGGACVPQQILRDTVDERAVRILLECILVLSYY